VILLQSGLRLLVFHDSARDLVPAGYFDGAQWSAGVSEVAQRRPGCGFVCSIILSGARLSW